MTAELEKKKTSAETDSESGEKLYTGRIVKSTGGLYRVEIGGEGADKTGETVDCRAKGAFRRDKLIPLTGDKVRLRVTRTGEGFITEILTRKNSLIRPAVANVDTLVLVIASAHPDPDLYILDKLTAIAAFNGIDTVLVINKCDLKNADELQKLYHTAGIPAFCLSASEPETSHAVLEQIRTLMHGKTCFFSGASGVGKSSLLNALYPSLLKLETGEISRKIARGKHTTRVTELFKVDESTYIGDTPGFSMVDVAGFNLLTSEGLLDSFPDISAFAHGCRYTDCTHLCEDGCKVVEAVKDGKIAPTRHESFVRLYKELKAVDPWKK